MRRVSLIMFLVGILLLLPMGASQSPDRMNVVADRLDIPLGEQQTTYVELHNPLDEEDTYTVDIKTNVDAGAALWANFSEGPTSDTLTVDIGPDSRRDVPVTVRTGYCTPSSTCEGSVSFVGRSLETDIRFVDEIGTVKIIRDSEVYGAPALTPVQLLVLLGMSMILFGSRH